MSDPLAHIPRSVIGDDFVLAITKYAVDHILFLSFPSPTGCVSGVALLKHVARSVAKEAMVRGTHEYLLTIGEDEYPDAGYLPLSSLFVFFGKLAYLIGGENMGKLFSSHLSARQNAYASGNFTVSPSVASTSPTPKKPAQAQSGEEEEEPSFTNDPRASFTAQNFAAFLSREASMRQQANATPSLSRELQNDQRRGLPVQRDIFTSHDEDVILSLAETKEHQEMMLALPAYSYVKSKQDFFRSAIVSIVRLALERKRNPDALLLELQERTRANLRQKGGHVPTPHEISLLITCYKATSPAVFVSALEVAALIKGDISSPADLQAIAFARCHYFTSAKESNRAKEGLQVKGWALCTGEKALGHKDF